VESLHPLPADLVAEGDDEQRVTQLRRITPSSPAEGLSSSAPLPQWPVLPQGSARAKGVGGVWLTQAGWAEHLAGRTPSPAQTLKTSALWAIDARVGVGLDAATRRAADGQLFSVQAVALHRGIGFLASVSGAEPPADGVLRFGGDGRGAGLTVARHQPAMPDWTAIARARRARVLLTTPALFPDGWRLPGADAEGRLTWPGLTARVVCAAVQRAEIISGWDLALRQPKAAERAAPAGSVYWLEDLDTTPEALGKLADGGLWLDDDQNAQRRAEGYNRCAFAAW